MFGPVSRCSYLMWQRCLAVELLVKYTVYILVGYRWSCIILKHTSVGSLRLADVATIADKCGVHNLVHFYSIPKPQKRHPITAKVGESLRYPATTAIICLLSSFSFHLQRHQAQQPSLATSPFPFSELMEVPKNMKRSG